MLLNFSLCFKHVVEWYDFEKCSSWGENAHNNLTGSKAQYISLTCYKGAKEVLSFRDTSWNVCKCDKWNDTSGLLPNTSRRGVRGSLDETRLAMSTRWDDICWSRMLRTWGLLYYFVSFCIFKFFSTIKNFKYLGTDLLNFLHATILLNSA